MGKIKSICISLPRVLFLITLLWIIPVKAQKKNNFSTIDAQAKAYFRAEEMAEALSLYLKLDSLESSDAYIKTRIGICYLFTEFKYKALPYLEKGKELGYTKDHIHYYLGRAYHLQHQFDKAISEYEESKKDLTGKKQEHVEMLKKAHRYIEMCQSGKELIKKPIDVKIENISSRVNSPYPDYAPVISADETMLIFTSRRPGSNGELKDEHGQYFEDIYMSVKENGQWSAPVNIGSNINTVGHDASIGLSPDGQELLIYKQDNGGDIYYSLLNGSRWSDPRKIPGLVNSRYWEPSASISADEKILFFTSDRPGGYGGRDIYVSRKLPNEQWDRPKNLGPRINTPYDEDAPFIHPDGRTLYFSSTGHNSMGGFDIFTAHYNPLNDSISKVANVGYPINTADDDVFFVWSADGKRAYFSSVRAKDNLGEKDIYVLTRPKPPVSLIVLKGRVFSKTTGQPLAATLTVTDNETNRVVGVYNSNSYTGKYTILVPPGKNYGIAAEAPKHLFYSENVYIPQQDDYYEVTRDIFLESLNEGSITILNNVFFEPGSSELKKESYSELHRIYKLLKEKNALRVEIACHTDSSGNEDSDLEITLNRALAIAKYFINKGIEPQRICAIGYGDKFNVAYNNSEEGRKRNRRTEIIILETVMVEEGAKDCAGFYYTKDAVNENYKLPDPKKKITEKIVKDLPPIRFDFNSFSVNARSRNILEIWSKFLLKNPQVRIEVGGHTDGKGSPAYNKTLSDRRVNSIKAYLASKGIRPERVVTRSYGESKPLASNETEEGRKKNRRVEITILK